RSRRASNKAKPAERNCDKWKKSLGSLTARFSGPSTETRSTLADCDEDLTNGADRENDRKPHEHLVHFQRAAAGIEHALRERKHRLPVARFAPGALLSLNHA